MRQVLVALTALALLQGCAASQAGYDWARKTGGDTCRVALSDRICAAVDQSIGVWGALTDAGRGTVDEVKDAFSSPDSP